MDKVRPYAEIVIGITGAVHGTGLYDPPTHNTRWSASNMWLKKSLPELAEGGYVIDLRPLAEHPQIVSWVVNSPMSSGRLTGDIERLPEKVRQAAGQMMPMLDGDYQRLAYMASEKIGEPEDSLLAGPFDQVSAAYMATYWASKGARVGKRIGDKIAWSNGEEQPVCGYETYLKGVQS
jgi:hypothetical protein